MSNPTLQIVRARDDERRMPPGIPADLVDETVLASRLGVSRSTLQSWRYNGCGPRFIKVGRLVRYSDADIEAYLRENVRNATR